MDINVVKGTIMIYTFFFVQENDLDDLHKEGERMRNHLKEGEIRIKLANAKADEFEQSYKVRFLDPRFCSAARLDE